MTRVISALVMLALVVGTLAWLPSWATLMLALLTVCFALTEYANLAQRAGIGLPTGIVVVAGLAVCAAVALGDGVDLVLMAATVAVGATALAQTQGRASGAWAAAAGMFGPLYVGLPVGTLVALHASRGAEVAFVLLAVIIASDTAQYYGGRAFGRRPLAPATSPKKTVEGAACGVVAAALVMLAAGPRVLELPAGLRVGFGAALAAVGLLGDLFESRLKREAGVKDVSGLIPGHGGVLDRVDSLLFAVPLYDIVLRGL